MAKFDIKIGSIQHQGWGTYNAKDTKELVDIINNQIENLNPINSTPEGAELYRQRFRGKPIFARNHNAKDYVKIAN